MERGEPRLTRAPCLRLGVYKGSPMALRCRCRGEPRHCSAPPFPSGATSSVLSTWWLPGADRPATHSGPVVMRSSGTVLIFCFIGFENMLRTGWLSHRIITEECVVTTFHTRGLLVYKENVTRVSMLPFSRRHPARKPHHRQLGPAVRCTKQRCGPVSLRAPAALALVAQPALALRSPFLLCFHAWPPCHPPICSVSIRARSPFVIFPETLLVLGPSGLFEETLQGCALLSGALVAWCHRLTFLKTFLPPLFSPARWVPSCLPLTPQTSSCLENCTFLNSSPLL